MDEEFPKKLVFKLDAEGLSATPNLDQASLALEHLSRLLHVVGRARGIKFTPPTLEPFRAGSLAIPLRMEGGSGAWLGREVVKVVKTKATGESFEVRAALEELLDVAHAELWVEDESGAQSPHVALELAPAADARYIEEAELFGRVVGLRISKKNRWTAQILTAEGDIFTSQLMGRLSELARDTFGKPVRCQVEIEHLAGGQKRVLLTRLEPYRPGDFLTTLEGMRAALAGRDTNFDPDELLKDLRGDWDDETPEQDGES